MGPFALAACQKEGEDPSTVTPGTVLPEIGTFSNLTVGNYWKYTKNKVDSNDVVLETVRTDSVYVAGDSVVNGATYAILRRAMDAQVTSDLELWKDSLTFLVNSDHVVRFCSAPLDAVIYQEGLGQFTVLYNFLVQSTPVDISVPAGDFSTYMMHAHTISFGTTPEVPAWKDPRSHWVSGVGRVRYYEFPAGVDWGYRYDLVSYTVQ